MKFYSHFTIIVLILMLAFSCKQGPKETGHGDHHLHPYTIQEQSLFSSAGAPIVLYKKDKVEILQIIKDTSDELEKLVTTKSDQEKIEVPIYSNGILQFEVPLRKNHPISKWKYEGIDTLAAISDVEGNYSILVS